MIQAFFIHLFLLSGFSDGVSPQRESALQNVNKIKSLLVEVASVSEGRDPDVNGNTRVLGIEGKKRYDKLWHNDQRFENDPASFMQFYDGLHFNLYIPSLRRYEIASEIVEDQHLKKLRNNLLTEIFGFNTLYDQSAVVFNLADYLKDSVASAESEDINNITCVRLAKNGVEVWLSQNDGDIIRRKHTFVTSERELTVELNYFSFETIKDVSFPTKVVRKFEGQRSFTTTHTLRYLRVNEDIGDIFEPVCPPGTLIVDRDKNRLSQIPGGRTFFEQLVKDYCLGFKPSQSKMPWDMCFAVVFVIGTFVFVVGALKFINLPRLR